MIFFFSLSVKCRATTPPLFITISFPFIFYFCFK
nr:MAG TPA: hypothetical protein [Caudoviricetes sp.]